MRSKTKTEAGLSKTLLHQKAADSIARHVGLKVSKRYNGWTLR